MVQWEYCSNSQLVVEVSAISHFLLNTFLKHVERKSPNKHHDFWTFGVGYSESLFLLKKGLITQATFGKLLIEKHQKKLDFSKSPHSMWD